MSIRIRSFADEAGASLEAQIAAMKRNGHLGPEIRGIDGRNVSQLNAEEALEIRQRLAAEGLSVRSVGSPIGKISVLDEFQPHLELFKRMLENAAVLGASHFRLFSFFMPEGQDPELFFDEVVDRLGVLLETAKPYGISLCHENEKEIYGDIASRCLKLHKALPEMKAVFDPANFIQCGQETLEAWGMLKPYVEYLHIKDALQSGVVVPAGEGIGHLPEILGEYLEAGGRELTLEPHLTVFSGMSALVSSFDDSLVGKFEYNTADEAFDAADAALKKLISEAGYAIG